MRQIILQYSIFLIIVFLILCVVVYTIFWKKRVFHSEEEYRAMNMPQEQLRLCLKLSKVLEYPIRVLMIATAVFVIWVAIPVLKDVKYIVSGEYSYVTGEIVNDVIKTGRAWRDRLVISDGNNLLELSVDSLSFEKGDIVTVKYLPNTYAGIIITK